MNIYVGNLSSNTTEDDLRQEFETFGAITSVQIIKDRYSNESRGFGFIEMPKKDEALAAMTNLNGKEFKGSTITVNEAKPKTDNRNRGGRGGDSGSGGGGKRRW